MLQVKTQLRYYIHELPFLAPVTSKNVSFLEACSSPLQILAFQAEELTRIGLYEECKSCLENLRHDPESCVSDVREILLRYARAKARRVL